MNTSTKMLIINLSGLALSLAGLVFLILSAFFYNTSNNLSFNFFALSLALLFIVLFIILPMSLENDFDP